MMHAHVHDFSGTPRALMNPKRRGRGHELGKPGRGRIEGVWRILCGSRVSLRVRSMSVVKRGEMATNHPLYHPR